MNTKEKSTTKRIPSLQKRPHYSSPRKVNPSWKSNPRRRKRKASTSPGKILVYITAGTAAALCIVYLCVSVWFLKHFLPHTAINGHDFSRQTAADVEAFFEEEVKGYSLTVIENSGKSEIIHGNEIALTCQKSQEIEQILKNQNAFGWPAELFRRKPAEVQIDLSYNEAALEQRIRSLSAVTAEQIPASSASPKFDGNTFIIEPESYGTAVNVNTVRECITNSVRTFAPKVNLNEEHCYDTPKYTSESEQVRQACQTLNTFCQAGITYSMDVPVVVDKALISTWVSVDEEMNVSLDETAIREWMREFGKRYDTLGSSRTFTSPAGKTAEVSGGTYGWSVDEDTEAAALVSHIRNGEVVTREPAWCQTAAVHGSPDWGSTYVDVDLSSQYMWYIVNGAVSLECSIVSGKPVDSMATPTGVYYISERLSPTVLVGEIQPNTGEPEYRTKVDYWMRVTDSGIGFHDADWQTAFGGDIYIYKGSHGCINMSVHDAQTFYSMVEVGVPVVIHY